MGTGIGVNTVMKKHEREALLGYLEFNLTDMVEQVEIKLVKKFDQEILNEIGGTLYDAAYEVLSEMERSLTELEEMNVSITPKS